MQEDNKKLGFAGRLARLFVMNKRLSLLLIITLFAWGIFSYFITPKQYNPEIVAPAFNVITEFSGADSREVNEFLTKPLENKITDISGVKDVMSQSMEGGVSIITVNFFVGENIEDSKIKLTQKIKGNYDLLPEGAGEPSIKEINPDDVPIMTIAFSSNEFSPVSLRRLVFDVRDKLRQVSGTSNMEVSGGRKFQLQILVDPKKTINRDVSVLQIVEALKKNNIKFLPGDLDLGEEKIAVELDSNIYNKKDLENLAIRSQGEDVLYLGDVAEIVSGEEEANNYVGYEKKSESAENAVYLSIAKKKGENITKVSQEVIKNLNNLEKNFIPDSVRTEIVRNEGNTARESVSGLMINLLQAIIIVSSVLFLFLGARAAFIVAIAIPLTLASVFGVGFLAGQTINRITLFALILSLGLLVDNATVIVENAVRHIRKNKNNQKSNQNAVIEAVDEVGKGLLMSTITTLFAFFPMAFVTGMMGPYMGPIPFFVPVALVVSLIIAFTINPFLSSVMLKAENKISSVRVSGKFGRLKEKAEKRFSFFMEKYKKLLFSLLENKKLRKKIFLIVFLLFFIAVSLPVTGLVKFRMLPKADKEQFFVYLDLPKGSDVEKTKQAVERAEDYLLDEEQVISVQSFTGIAPILDFNGLFKGASARKNPYNGTIKVNLTHPDDRDFTSEEIVLETREKLYDLFENNPDVKIKLIEDPPGPPVLSTMLLKIKGSDSEKLKEISFDVEKMLTDTEEVMDIDTSRDEDKKKLSLRVDYDRAQKNGIDGWRAAQALQIALSGSEVSVLHNENSREQEFIFIRFDKDYRDEIDDLRSVYILNNFGEKTPLLEAVEVEWKASEDVIYRDNGRQTVYVYGEMGDRSVTYAVLDMYKKLWNYKLNDGQGDLDKVSFFGLNFKDKNTGDDYRIEWGGEWKLTVEVFRDLGLAMMVAIFLIYLALVGQFHSFKTPLVIMITIPLALIGVLPGFALLGAINGLYFNATSMIGVIALAGIVVNNAIILTEYIADTRRQGLSRIDSLVEAGATRLRPIVLTSLTTVLGSFTIIADPVWAGLAWSVIFGISVSTVLTLVIFPVLFYSFEGER